MYWDRDYGDAIIGMNMEAAGFKWVVSVVSL